MEKREDAVRLRLAARVGEEEAEVGHNVGDGEKRLRRPAAARCLWGFSREMEMGERFFGCAVGWCELRWAGFAAS